MRVKCQKPVHNIHCLWFPAPGLYSSSNVMVDEEWLIHVLLLQCWYPRNLQSCFCSEGKYTVYSTDKEYFCIPCWFWVLTWKHLLITSFIISIWWGNYPILADNDQASVIDVFISSWLGYEMCYVLGVKPLALMKFQVHQNPAVYSTNNTCWCEHTFPVVSIQISCRIKTFTFVVWTQNILKIACVSRRETKINAMKFSAIQRQLLWTEETKLSQKPAWNSGMDCPRNHRSPQAFTTFYSHYKTHSFAFVSSGINIQQQYIRTLVPLEREREQTSPDRCQLCPLEGTQVHGWHWETNQGRIDLWCKSTWIHLATGTCPLETYVRLPNWVPADHKTAVNPRQSSQSITEGIVSAVWKEYVLKLQSLTP